MAVSQNGWPVDPPRSSRLIPGTTVKVTVADGPAGEVLLAVLAQIDRRVEDIDLRSTRGELDDWGFANRNVRGGTDTSNHASATAVDVNATRHPLGVRGTFTKAQVLEIHKILAEYGNVVRWGGDYSGRVDEMHFEINAAPEQVAAIWAKISRSTGGMVMDKEVKAAFDLVTKENSNTQGRVNEVEAKLDNVRHYTDAKVSEVLAGVRAIAAKLGVELPKAK